MQAETHAAYIFSRMTQLPEFMELKKDLQFKKKKDNYSVSRKTQKRVPIFADVIDPNHNHRQTLLTSTQLSNEDVNLDQCQTPSLQILSLPLFYSVQASD